MALFEKRPNFKRLFLSCFSWLLLAATGFDAAVAGYRVFVLAPRLNAALEQSATAPVAPAQNPTPQLLPPEELRKINLAEAEEPNPLQIDVYNGHERTSLPSLPVINESTTGTGWNSPPKSLAPGITTQPTTKPEVSVRTYTIKKGDSVAKIAREHSISYEELQKANKDLKPEKIQPGQVLKIP